SRDECFSPASPRLCNCPVGGEPRVARVAVVCLGSRYAADLCPVGLGETAGNRRTASASRGSLNSRWGGHQRTESLTLTSRGLGASPVGGDELCIIYTTPLVPTTGNDPAAFVGSNNDDDEHGGYGRLYRGYDPLWLGYRHVGNVCQSRHDWADAARHRRSHQRLSAATG